VPLQPTGWPCRTADGAGSARVIAGQLGAAKGPAHTFTPIDLLDVHLSAGRRVELDLRDGHSATLYILEGKIVVNGNEPANEGELVVFDRVESPIALPSRTKIGSVGRPVAHKARGR